MLFSQKAVVLPDEPASYCLTIIKYVLDCSSTNMVLSTRSQADEQPGCVMWKKSWIVPPPALLVRGGEAL